MNEQKLVRDLLAFIDQSPSPWHAVATVKCRLDASGFSELNEAESWSLQEGGKYYVVRDGSSIICFVLRKDNLLRDGCRILGAHTDSPGLRVKPNPMEKKQNLLVISAEVYGGPILATFSDRDLSLAGRIAYLGADNEIKTCLLHIDQPLLRLANLAIHMNRKVNEDGLKFNRQTELGLLMATDISKQEPLLQFKTLLQQQSGIEHDRILSWDLQVFDTQKGAFWGMDNEFYANSQIDNLASCHAGLTAFLDESSLQSENTVICAFFDHEEIGSASLKGADGSFLQDVLARLSESVAGGVEPLAQLKANSFMISADMAHAYQPAFSWAFEPAHKVQINQGPVIKSNCNQRYATEAVSEAHFITWCGKADVPYQKYSHRADIPCGSTIGPMSSAKLGIRCIDVGNPMWAMHSARESAGVKDHAYMVQVLQQFFAET